MGDVFLKEIPKEIAKYIMLSVETLLIIGVMTDDIYKVMESSSYY